MSDATGNAAAVRAVLADLLDLPADTDWSAVHYRTTPGWDSLVHLAVVAALEDSFGIAMSDEDILALDGYPAALDILRQHGVPA